MPVDRPTFSESWYRVAELRPRLVPGTRIHRQDFRGQIWFVIQHPCNTQFFRLSAAGYRFIALLDGSRTVAQAWDLCNRQLGDQAPTQGEAITLMGQLYTSNLLHADLPGDTEVMFRRYRKRIHREVRGYLMNLLFIRIPIFDPDHFLNSWLPIFGRLFTWAGLVLLAVLMGIGLYCIAGRTDQLAAGAGNILDPDNLLLLYLSFAMVKVFHEFGHAFACKRFGRLSGSGGEVHVMGVMFLIFTPMPYVDASSAWALRNKWHRAVVGAGGILVELGIASLAAAVWAATSTGAVNAIAYNVMFIASVSTLLFNGNPLLRYDGYYILADLLEIPNLAQRSKDYLYYLVRKYAWKVRQVQNPAHTRGEKIWFVFYGIASTIYRVVICVAILLFVADKLLLLGLVLAGAAAIAWMVVPLFKFIHYLAASNELARTRSRAVVSSAVCLLVILGGLGLIPAPDRYRVEGVIEPVHMAVIYAGADGFVQSTLPSNSRVAPGYPVLITSSNEDLQSQRNGLAAQLRELQARRRLAQTQEQASAQIVAEQIAAVEVQLRRCDQQVADLQIKPPLAGTWVSPEVERLQGGYLRRGDKAGIVADMDDVIVRSIAGQDVVAPLVAESSPAVTIRVKGRPDLMLEGKVVAILPAGQQQLPSAALGYQAGGSIQTAADDKHGTKAAEQVFEIRVAPAPSPLRLLGGQRVIVRFETASKPYLVQWWRSLLQLLQRRFQSQ